MTGHRYLQTETTFRLATWICRLESLVLVFLLSSIVPTPHLSIVYRWRAENVNMTLCAHVIIAHRLCLTLTFDHRQI